jgi:hypothetical protein
MCSAVVFGGACWDRAALPEPSMTRIASARDRRAGEVRLTIRLFIDIRALLMGIGPGAPGWTTRSATPNAADIGIERPGANLAIAF